jgi:hypothetical protein
MPPVGNLPQLPLVARRPVRAYGMPPVENLPPVVPTTGLAEVNDARAMSRFGESTPAVPTTGLAEVNDARAISRFGNLLPAVPTTRRAGSTTQGRYPGLGIYPSSPYDRTRRGQRRKGDVSVWESTPRECLRPDAPRLTAEGRCPGFAADGVWQLVPVPCADCPVAAQ